MLKRIKYVSRFAHPLSVANIQKLADDSAVKNAALDITGVLMASGGLFFQVLEGPPAAVDRLFERIARDDRHEQLVVLRIEQGEGERRFASWGMGAAYLGDDARSRSEPARQMLHAVLNQWEATDRLSSRLENTLQGELSRASQRRAGRLRSRTGPQPKA